MRRLMLTTIGILAASALLFESDALNGSQAPQVEPATPPSTQINPDQNPPPTPPQPALGGPNAVRPGMRPRFAPGQPPAAGLGTFRTAPPAFGNQPPAVRNQPPAVRPTPPAAPLRPLQSVFLMPAGLSMDPADLSLDLGYDPVTCIPLTPTTSFDIAYKCYSRGLYSDAIIFARHGLTMCNDARLHLLKGDCELHLGRCAEAEKTASDFREALTQQQAFGIESAHERVNDAMAVRFDDIVRYQDTGR